MIHLRNRHFFIGDLIILPVVVYFCYVLRLERFNLTQYWPSFLLFATLVLLVTPFIFRRIGLYSRYWKYASIGELLSLTIAALLSALIAGGIGVVGSRVLLQGIPTPFLPGTWIVPRSIPFIFLFLTPPATSLPRLAVRLLPQLSSKRFGDKSPLPVLVVGAGDAGTMIVRELQTKPHLGKEVIGFLDDDPGKQSVRIHGVPVLGDRSNLAEVVRGYFVHQVIIAMPTAAGEVIREIVKQCEQLKVQTRIIPGIYEMLDGRVHVNQLREVNIEDLLRREPVETNTDAIRALTKGKRVMVTGGGGSIGSELCRQIAQFEPEQLVVLDHGENSIFYIQSELRRRFPELDLVARIADIRTCERVRSIYEQYRPEIVFHAAAHKHVPLMELNPCEAITNNVLGTRNVVELAAEYDVSHFVMISTDKAVNPTNVMGASKRCAELIVHEVARKNNRPYVAVRFGNVLGSNGSVVPHFKQQIASGGPVTVTHPEMRRFFMTIPEAVQLVLQAAALGSGGEVFLLDMGEPVRIVDLARDLIELSGLRPGADIEIVFTGVRPGEKLYEELFIKGETYQRTAHEKIFVLESATRAQLDSEKRATIEALIKAALQYEEDRIIPLLQQSIPEYQPGAFEKLQAEGPTTLQEVVRGEAVANGTYNKDLLQDGWSSKNGNGAKDSPVLYSNGSKNPHAGD